MNILNVACAIIMKEEKIFAAKRSETMSLPLKWEFPGGKINDNETQEECIHRELQEELNIKVNIIGKLRNYYHSYGETKINFVPFIVEYNQGKIILLEHREAGWFSKEELVNLDWASADIAILNEFLNKVCYSKNIDN